MHVCLCVFVCVCEREVRGQPQKLPALFLETRSGIDLELLG